MRHLRNIPSTRAIFQRVSLLGMALVFAIGSYAVFIPKPAQAVDCTNIGQGVGVATATVTIPSDGTYRIWNKVMAANTSDTVLVSIDNQHCIQLGNTPLPAGEWAWIGHQNGDTTVKATATMSAGTHTVKLIGTEAGIKVNQALFVKDTDCIPVATGENCKTSQSGSDTLAPSTPANVRTTITSAKLISVSWAASQDNVGIKEYDVYRNNAKIATVTETAFHDSALAASTSYTYSVKARDAAGNESTLSAPISAATLARAPQGKGKLYGKVTFSRDDAATATVSFMVNGSLQTHSTDARGYYFITDIPAGTYLMKYQAGNSVKYFDIKIKSSGDTIKDVSLPKALIVQPPAATPLYTTVNLSAATLSNGAVFVTESDATKSILFPSASDPDPDPNPTGRNCIVKPSACGYPDETNTGYKPTGVTPTTDGVTINHEGDFIVTQPGAIIDGKKIEGCVHIKAPNVTIKRSLITGCQSYFNIRVFPEGGNFTLEDTEVDGNNFASQNAALVDDSNGPLTVRRMYMHNVADGPHPGAHWLIEDSYITDLYACNICHNDTIQSAGAVDVTLRHNTIINTPEDHPSGEGGKNAVVRIATEQGTVNGFVIENNLLSGGNFAVQIREQGNGYPQGVKVIGNRIVSNWRFAPYDIGPIENYIMGTVEFSGNYRDDSGQQLNTI